MVQKPYSLDKLLEIANGDQAFVDDMLVLFIDNVTEDIEKIKSLRQTDDWKAIAGIAHRLASRFAYLCVDGLYKLSDDIEKSVLVRNDLEGIAEKTDRLCKEGILLIEEFKNEFEFFE